jgi:hypothetical protein
MNKQDGHCPPYLLQTTPASTDPLRTALQLANQTQTTASTNILRASTNILRASTNGLRGALTSTALTETANPPRAAIAVIEQAQI